MKVKIQDNKMQLPGRENKMFDAPTNNKKKLKITEARLEFTVNRLRDAMTAVEKAIKEKNRFHNIINIYYPALLGIGDVQAWYNGRYDGVSKVCPNVTGELIVRYIRPRKAYNILPGEKKKPLIVGG